MCFYPYTELNIIDPARLLFPIKFILKHNTNSFYLFFLWFRKNKDSVCLLQLFSTYSLTTEENTPFYVIYVPTN